MTDLGKQDYGEVYCFIYLCIFIMIEFYIKNKFTLQSIFKNKNVREVYSTYMKQDSMGTDKWRGFTYTKGPPFW